VSAATYSDVIEVGGGLAGLRTATLLQKAGYSVTVLESNSELGGRVRNYALQTAPGVQVPVGGTYFSPAMTRMLGLAAEAGLNVIPLAPTGPVTPLIAPPSFAASPPNGIIQLFGLGSTVTPNQETLAPTITTDFLSVDDFLASLVMDDIYKEQVRDMLHSFFSIAQTDKASALYVAEMVYQTLKDTFATIGFFPPSVLSVLEGTGRLPEFLASQLNPQDVHTGQMVKEIKQSANAVTVITTDNSSYCGKFVVAAISPIAASKITYDPPLKAETDAFLDGYFDDPEDTSNFIIVYPNRWWESKGLAMFGLPSRSFEETSPLNFSGSISDLSILDPSHTLGIVRIEAAAKFKGSSRDVVLTYLFALTGQSPEAFGAQEFYEKDWTADYATLGAHNSILSKGILAGVGAGSEYYAGSSGRIIWAGTEHSPVFRYQMEGALASGEAAARTVAALKSECLVRTSATLAPTTCACYVSDLAAYCPA